MELPAQSLAGRRVVVTREHPGELAEMLASRGASVLHVPLIAVGDPADDGVALGRELERIEDYDWLVVTSPEGARRVGAEAGRSGVRLAAVGTATGRALEDGSGRSVDVVPPTQRAEALAVAIIDASAGTRGRRVLIAHAELAADDLGAALRSAGFEVVEVNAYATSIGATASRSIPVESVLATDAVLFASGSAVRGWMAAYGASTPPIVVAIGPATGEIAAELGIGPTSIAAEHSLGGLVAELEARLV